MTSPTPAADESVIDVLARFADDGWTADHIARPYAKMRCGVCSRHSLVAELETDAMHRVEGASDPDDMQMVVGLTCPYCASRGAVVLAYGPSASETDSEFVGALTLDNPADPVANDPGTTITS